MELIDENIDALAPMPIANASMSTPVVTGLFFSCR
jgi:hypothetical protein